MAQKVVIPKGLVNPNETTIVEIPNNLKNVGTVVARARPASPASSACPPQAPATPKMVKKRSYTRRTYPPKNTGKIIGQLHEHGTSFGGRDFDSEDESPKAKPRNPKCPYNEISQGDVSYAVGAFGKQGFNPNRQSTLLGIDDTNYSPFKEFQPPKASSRPGSPAVKPRSVRRYQSSDTPPGSYYKSEVTTTTPEEIQTEITEEESYVDYGDADTSGEECGSPATSSSGGYQQYHDSSSGAYKKFESSSNYYGSQSMSPGSSGSSKPYSHVDTPHPNTSGCNKLSQREVMDSLGELEANELSQIMNDLSQFQTARRRLVFDASSLASPADVSTSLLASKMGLCNNDTKRKRPFKTIIIPRGIINPNQNNVIEIPMTLETNSSLIVKAPNDENPCFSVEPYRGDINTLPLGKSSSTPDPRQYTYFQENVRQIPQSSKHDFGVQTQNTDQNYSPKLTSVCMQAQPPCFVPEAHSPLCPICSRASCKYNLINRSTPNRFNPPTSFTPNFYPTSMNSNPPCPTFGASTSNGYSQPSYGGTSCGFTPTTMSLLQNTRSENFTKSRDRLENETLSRLLDEKIDKILKPILLSLAKMSTDDEERELNQKYLGAVCAPKVSCNSIQGRNSRECFKKGSNLACMGSLLRNSGSDCETKKDPCSSNGYYRRTNVSFDEKGSRCKDLNKSFRGCSSNNSICRNN